MNCTQQLLDALRNKVVFAIHNVVNSFRQGADEEGYSNLVQLIDPIENLISFASGQMGTEKITQLNNNLMQVLQAMEQGDPVLLADYLEYGILPIIREL